MEINQAIPCYEVTHYLLSGGWSIDPAYAKNETEFNQVMQYGDEVLVLVDVASIIDALEEGFTLISEWTAK